MGSGHRPHIVLVALVRVPTNRTTDLLSNSVPSQTCPTPNLPADHPNARFLAIFPIPQVLVLIGSEQSQNGKYGVSDQAESTRYSDRIISVRVTGIDEFGVTWLYPMSSGVRTALDDVWRYGEHTRSSPCYRPGNPLWLRPLPGGFLCPGSLIAERRVKIAGAACNHRPGLFWGFW